MVEQADVDRKLTQAINRYPAEQARLEQCAAAIAEHNHPMLNRALDKQLERILAASDTQKARKEIDKMEHSINKSALLAPFLGARQEPGAARRRQRIVVALVSLAVLMIALSVLLELGR